MEPAGYRVQSVEVCGANCTTQYWVSSLQSGDQLLEIDPVRGGAILAVAQPTTDGAIPSVRVVMPQFAPTDAACCPSTFSDTTYNWDPSSGSLVAADSNSTPASEFPGVDAARQELTNEGWIIANV
jgi:hypothetical protein